MRKLIICAALLLSSAPTALSAGTVPSYDVATFDIVGIKLGMSPERVETIMKERGFAVRKAASYFNFKSAVEDEARRLKQPVPDVPSHKGPSSIFGNDTEGNHLSIDFADIGEGYIVTEVSLNFDKETNVQNQIPSDLSKRYGKPSYLNSNGIENNWCTAGDAGCRNNFLAERPIFIHDWFPGHIIKLSSGKTYKQLKKERVAALFSKPSGDRQRSLLSGN